MILPLRLRVTPDMTCAELARAVSHQTRQALRRQRFPGLQIAREAPFYGPGARSFGPVVNVKPFDYDFTFAGAAARLHNLTGGPVEDLADVFYDTGAGLQLDLDASAARYSAEAAADLKRRLLRVLAAFAADGAQRVGDLALLEDGERRQILHDWNDTAHPVQAATFADLFEAQASRTPDAVAILHDDQRITYAQLNAAANRMAHQLIAGGIGPEDIKAVCPDRSPGLLVAMVGILKAGAAYMPLDPDYPASRLALLLIDAQPKLVLAAPSNAAIIAGAAPGVCLAAMTRRSSSTGWCAAA